MKNRRTCGPCGPGKMKKIIKKIACAALAVSLFVTCAGCQKTESSSSPLVNFFVSLDDDEIIKIEGTVCSLEEAMIVLMSYQNEYKDILGDDGWETQIGDQSVREYVLECAKSDLSAIYAFCAMAGEYEIELDEDELEAADSAADEYFVSLNEDETGYAGASEEDAEALFESVYLAAKTYESLADEYTETQISDETARVAEIQYAFVTDEETAQYIYETAQDEYQDFLLLAQMYSEDETNEIDLKRGDMTDEFEEAAFALDDGQISEIISADGGYYIIKCETSYLEDETAANKALLTETARQESVSAIYEEFLDGASSIFNSGVWENIEFSENENVTSTEFNEILSDVFSGVTGEASGE